MSKLKIILLVFLIITGFFSHIPKTNAAEDCSLKTDFSYHTDPETINEDAGEAKIILEGVEPGSYQLRIGWGLKPGEEDLTTPVKTEGSSVTLTINKEHNKLSDRNQHIATVMKDGKEYCGYLVYAIAPKGVSCTMTPKVIRPSEKLEFKATGLEPNAQFQLQFSKYSWRSTPFSSNSLGEVLVPDISLEQQGLSTSEIVYVSLRRPVGETICSRIPIRIEGGSILPKVTYWCRTDSNEYKESKSCSIAKDIAGSPKIDGATADKAACDNACAINGTTFLPIKNELATKSGSLGSAGGIACDIRNGSPIQASTSKFYTGKDNSVEVEAKYAGVLTAIGCVPTQPKDLVNGLIKFFALASGGIAMVLMLIAVLKWLTAMGNPENLNNARDQFFSALIGLLFILFSVLLLQIIGVDVLGLPGFKT